jgi:RimJ/RimL family protein N-acetyltransferase
MKTAISSFEIVYGNKSNPDLNKILCDYVAYLVWGCANDFGPSGSIGVLKNKQLIAAVVFHNWHENHGVIELSAAASDPRWLTKTVIKTIMEICFGQHKCQQIATRIDIENERALKIFRFLGFSELILPNMRGSGKHEILMLFTSEQWKQHRLNEVKNGQTDSTST